MLWHYLREGWHILLTLQCKCFDSAKCFLQDKHWKLANPFCWKASWMIYYSSSKMKPDHLFFFFCLFEIIEKIRVYGYSSMWNREIDLVLIYFSWEDCKKAILSLLLKANSKKCPTRWNEPAIVLLLQCTVCWIKKGLLIWHLGKFAGE